MERHLPDDRRGARRQRPDFVYVPTATLVKYNAEWTGPLLGDKAWPVQFDLTKLKVVVGEFTCDVSTRGPPTVLPHYRQRADGFVPDEASTPC